MVVCRTPVQGTELQDTSTEGGTGSVGVLRVLGGSKMHASNTIFQR